MIVTHEDACIVTHFLESDAVAIERHLMAAGVVVEPEVIQAVTRCLSFVSGVADIKHDSWLLTEKFFEYDSHHFENL